MVAIEYITSSEVTKTVEVNGVKRTFTVQARAPARPPTSSATATCLRPPRHPRLPPHPPPPPTRHWPSQVWNATVANLTLMALGSSAPEILLSVIEIVSSGFFAGELGPSTIVGSAAFNLLVICAVCIVAIPAGEARPRPRAPPRRRPPALAPLDLIGRLPPPLAPPTAS